MPNVDMEMVVAVSKNGVIGDSQNNGLLWNLPEDLAHFYRLTNGHVVIMGHKTFQSLPHGKLKNRINVVLTKHPPTTSITPVSLTEPNDNDYYLVDLATMWDVLSRHADKKVFVIGGAAIYQLLFPFCSKIHFTLVNIVAEGDVRFPFSLDELAIASCYIEEKEMATSASLHRIPYQFLTYHLDWNIPPPHYLLPPSPHSTSAKGFP